MIMTTSCCSKQPFFRDTSIIVFISAGSVIKFLCRTCSLEMLHSPDPTVNRGFFVHYFLHSLALVQKVCIIIVSVSTKRIEWEPLMLHRGNVILTTELKISNLCVLYETENCSSGDAMHLLR